MKNDDSYLKVFSGSEVVVTLIQGLLEKAGLTILVKNEFQSGITSGFAGGTANTKGVFVHKSEEAEAMPIVNEFLRNQKKDKT